MLLDTCGSLQTVFWGFWLEKLWKLKGTQEIASEAKCMSPLWHLNRVFPCPFEVPLGRFHVPLNIQRDISGASAKLRTPLKNHKPRTIHLWLFTGEGAPAPSPGNSQRWMMHCFVFIHDPGSGFFRGVGVRPWRVGEAGNGRGRAAGSRASPDGGRSGSDGGEMGRFRLISGRKSLESEARTLFFAVQPEREPYNSVLPSGTRPKRRFSTEFSTFPTFSRSFARFMTPVWTERGGGERIRPGATFRARFGVKNGRERTENGPWTRCDTFSLRE